MAISSPSNKKEKRWKGFDIKNHKALILGSVGFLAFSAIVLAVLGPAVEFPIKIGRTISEGIDDSIGWATPRSYI